VLGAPLAMLADAMSFLGSVVFLRRIRSPEPPVEPEAGSIREQLMVGLSFVFRDGVMRGVLLSVATINLFTFASSALFILYATTQLGVSPGRARSRSRNRRGRVRDRCTHRIADRPAHRAWSGLRAGLPDLPGLAAADPAGRGPGCRRP